MLPCTNFNIPGKKWYPNQDEWHAAAVFYGDTLVLTWAIFFYGSRWGRGACSWYSTVILMYSYQCVWNLSLMVWSERASSPHLILFEGIAGMVVDLAFMKWMMGKDLSSWGSKICAEDTLEFKKLAIELQMLE